MMIKRFKEIMKVKLIDSSIPAVVGLSMMGITYPIVDKVRNDILGIAEQAAKKAVSEALDTVAPPINWISAKAITPEVKIGGILEIEYTAIVRKQCPADLRAFLLNADSGDAAAYRFPDQAGGYRKADDKPQTWRIKITVIDPPSGGGLPPLEAGTYKYRVTAIRYCERIALDSEVPDATFKLIR